MFPSSPLFSPCKILSYSLWRNKMKLWTDIKIFLCRSAARWSIWQNIRSMGREKKAGKSFLLGLLMSYKLKNTDSSRTSLCLSPKDWEGMWLRWWTQASLEHRLEQRLLDRVTMRWPTAVMVLDYESSLCPCFVCTPTESSPERCHNQKELSSSETNSPCIRFLIFSFTLDVVQLQLLVANTSVLLLQNSTLRGQAVEFLVIKATSILQNHFSFGISCVFRILSVFNTADTGLLLKDINDPD